jgi:hypothetical protein
MRLKAVVYGREQIGHALDLLDGVSWVLALRKIFRAATARAAVR